MAAGWTIDKKKTMKELEMQSIIKIQLYPQMEILKWIWVWAVRQKELIYDTELIYKPNDHGKSKCRKTEGV